MFNRKKVEPAPDRAVVVSAHRFKLRAREMAQLDVDFENAPALRALKNSSRTRLTPTLRTTKLAHRGHRVFSLTVSHTREVKYYSNIPLLHHSNFLTPFSVPAR